MSVQWNRFYLKTNLHLPVQPLCGFWLRSTEFNTRKLHVVAAMAAEQTISKFPWLSTVKHHNTIYMACEGSNEISFGERELGTARSRDPYEMIATSLIYFQPKSELAGTNTCGCWGCLATVSQECTVQNRKNQNIQEYNITCRSVMVWNLVSDIKGETQTEGVWERGAEEVISTEEGWGDGRLEKTA
jgi:hypothetical protein